MSKYWNDKQDFKDYINADDFNEAFAQIDTDVAKNTADVAKKVDKVDGKSLIDSSVADKLSGDDNSVLYKSTDTNASIEVANEHEDLALIMSHTKIKSDEITVANLSEGDTRTIIKYDEVSTPAINTTAVHMDSTSSPATIDLGADKGVKVYKTPTDSEDMDITLEKIEYNAETGKTNTVTHRLSQKADKADVLSPNMDGNTVIKLGNYDIERQASQYSIDDIRFQDHDGTGDTVYGRNGLTIQGKGSHKVYIDNTKGIKVTQYNVDDNPADIILTYNDYYTGEHIPHKLSEKANAADVFPALKDAQEQITTKTTTKLDYIGWNHTQSPPPTEVEFVFSDDLKGVYAYGDSKSYYLKIHTSDASKSIYVTGYGQYHNLLQKIKEMGVEPGTKLFMYAMCDEVWYADVMTYQAMPKIYEESGSLYVNVNEKKFKLTATEV